MRSNTAIILIRAALVFVFLIGLGICLYWYPFSVTLSTGISILDYDPMEITAQENIEFYSQLLFYWIISLPCFAVVLMGFICTGYTRKYGRFNEKSAKLLFIMAAILFISSLIFLFGNLIFMFLDWNPLPLLYCIIGGAGMLISAGLYAAHRYIAKRACEV